MATFSEVSNLLLRSTAFPAAVVSDNLIKAEVSVGEGRTQIVFAGQIGDNLVFSSIVCKLSDVNLEALFKSQYMTAFPHGVGPIGDMLAVKHVTLLETLQMEEISDAIGAVAVLGDMLEKAITGGDAF